MSSSPLVRLISLVLLLAVLVLCAEDYYKLLGVSKSANDRELKRAYRKLSKQYHPDKNPGDEAAAQKFVSISDAYDALSQPDLRKIYDQYGHDGLEKHKQTAGRGGPAHHDPFDLFSRFFGGGGGGFGGERRGPNKEVRIAVPLRDFYVGRKVEFSIEKQLICDHCDGSGSHDGHMDTCGQCGGRGMVIQKAMLAPGIFQQVQSPCGSCGGKGKVVRTPCKVCGGQRVVRQQETYTVPIDPGMPRGSRVTLESEADESPDYVAGDLFVVIAEQDPATAFSDVGGSSPDGYFFRRRGRDLFWREVLSLREAWMGDWSRNVTHLDGHSVKLSRPRGQVVQPNMVEVVAGEGMPVWNEEKDHHDLDAEDYGNLYVEYQVILPDQMESGMEKEFWTVWDKWRRKKGVDLHKDSGRPAPKPRMDHEEL